MSIYGYNTAVSPANTGGYGYGGYGPVAGAMGQANVMPVAAANANAMPIAAGANAMPVAGAGTKGIQPLAMPMQAMPMQAMPPSVPSGAFVTQGGGTIVTAPAVEESYLENILRLNRGKVATFYMTYENNREWNAKVFKGVIEAAGRDHIIISDPATGMRYLLLTLNLDYVTFTEPINYEYPFHGGTITNQTPMTATAR